MHDCITHPKDYSPEQIAEITNKLLANGGDGKAHKAEEVVKPSHTQQQYDAFSQAVAVRKAAYRTIKEARRAHYAVPHLNQPLIVNTPNEPGFIAATKTVIHHRGMMMQAFKALNGFIPVKYLEMQRDDLAMMRMFSTLDAATSNAYQAELGSIDIELGKHNSMFAPGSR
jgi:hypothetical protein